MTVRGNEAFGRHIRILSNVGGALALLMIWPVLSASAQPPAAPALGSPNFLPTPDQAVGWRGDGSGRYPGATPPREWYIRLKNAPGLACSASKPKAPPATIDGAPDMALNEWITIGPWPSAEMKTALDTAYVPDDLNVEPSEGDKVGDKQWKKLPTQNGAVCFAEVYGESPKDQTKVVYAVTYVYAPSDGDVSLFWTHSGGGRLYLNGQLIAEKKQGDFWSGQPGTARLPLKTGWNRLMLKTCGGRANENDEAWAFSAWVQRLPAKGVKYEYETKNIVYQAPLPRGSQIQTPGPIVVGDKLFLTGEHWLAAIRKQDGQLLWYRSIIAFDGRAQDTKGDAAVIEQYNAACRKMHDLDAQYPQQFKDGKIPAALESQYKQVSDELRDLLAKLDGKRAASLKGAWESGEPGWALTPCSDGKSVYVWSQQAVAACYDLDGKQQWSTTVDYGGNTHHGWSASPVLADGKFVCPQRKLWAFDTKTGALAWSTDFHTSWGSVIRAHAGAEPVLVSVDNFVYSAKDGRPFGGDKGTNPGGGNCSTSIPIEPSQAFSISGGFILTSLGASVQHAKIAKPPFNLCGGTFADWAIASPVFHDGFAYVLTQGGTLITVDLSARKVANVEHLDTRINWGGRPGATASPSFAGGRLYFFDDSGNTIVREPGPQGKVIARNPLFQAATDNYGRPETTKSTPVFDESRIYWRVNNRLYCIGEK